MLIALPLAPFRKRHKLVKIWAIVAMQPMARFIAGIKWEVKGKENIPENPVCFDLQSPEHLGNIFYSDSVYTANTGY